MHQTKLFLGFIFLFLSGCFFTQKENNLPAPLTQNTPPILDTFWIDAQKDTLLQSQLGLLFSIPAKAFEQVEKSLNQPFCIVIKEYTEPHQLNAFQLFHQDQKQHYHLQSIVSIQAFHHNQIVGLQKGKELKIRFPKNSEVHQQLLFHGMRNETGWVHWTADSTSKPSIWLNGWKGLGFDWHWQRTWEPFSFEGSGNNLFQDDLQELFSLYPNNGSMNNGQYQANFTISDAGRIQALELSSWNEKKRTFQKLTASKKQTWERFFQSMPALVPYSFESKPVETNCQWSFSVSPFPPQLDTSMRTTYTDDSLGISFLNHTEMDYHIFNTTKLGWLACGSKKQADSHSFLN